MIKIYVTCENKNNLITTIPFKGVKVQVEFTGGNVMKGLPAKFYCSDPFTQKALDESDQKDRLYRLVQVIPEESDGKPAVASAPQVAEAPAAADPEPAPEPPADDTTGGTTTDPNPDPVPDAGEGDGSGSAADEKLEFENLAEAVTYIAAHYGEQVESESQVRKFLEEKEGKKCIIHKG